MFDWKENFDIGKPIQRSINLKDRKEIGRKNQKQGAHAVARTITCKQM